jgi:hypothetical protein
MPLVPPVPSAIAQVKIRMIVVRIAVARFELTVDTPTLAKTAVSPANNADNNAQVSHRIPYHRQKIGLCHLGSSCRRVGVAGTLPLITHHQSPFPGFPAFLSSCTSRFSMQLSPP